MTKFVTSIKSSLISLSRYTTPDPMGHAIPAGTPRPPRRNSAFRTHNHLTQLKIVMHAKAKLAHAPT